MVTPKSALQFLSMARVDGAAVGRAHRLAPAKRGTPTDPLGAGTIVVPSLFWAFGSVYCRDGPQPSAHALLAGMQMIGGRTAALALSLATGDLTGLDLGAVSAAAFAAWVYVAVFGSVANGSRLWLLKVSILPKAATMPTSIPPSP